MIRRFLTALALLVLLAPSALAEQWTYLMDEDPRLTPQRGKMLFPKEAVEIWRQAAQRQEEEMRRLLGESIARAQRSGLVDLSSLAPDLRTAFRQSRGATRVNLASALIALNDLEMASELAAAADKDVNLAAIVEPALATWDIQSRRPEWRRIVSQGGESLRRRLLAVRACGQVRDSQALASLAELVLDGHQMTGLRIAAAEAAGLCSADADADPLPLAQQLVQQDSHLAWMLAARLLRHARQDASLPLLKRIATHHSLAVAPLGCERLGENWPQTLVELADTTAGHASPLVRIRTLRTMAEHGGPRAPALLGGLLGDAHPQVRMTAADELIRVAGEELRPSVLEQVDAALAGDRWQAHAQGLRVAEVLNHTDAIPAAFKLLNKPSIESRNAAAFFLGRRALPEHLPEIWTHVQQLLASRQTGLSFVPADEELMQLLQGIGRLRALEADAKLQQILQKNSPYPFIMRAAAGWALGKLHADDNQRPLAEFLMERVNDVVDPFNSEADVVRKMCMISLGRMKAVPQLPELRKHDVGVTSMTDLANAWAQEQITGKPVETPGRPTDLIIDSGYFLLPVPSFK